MLDSNQLQFDQSALKTFEKDKNFYHNPSLPNSNDSTYSSLTSRSELPNSVLHEKRDAKRNCHLGVESAILAHLSPDSDNFSAQDDSIPSTSECSIPLEDNCKSFSPEGSITETSLLCAQNLDIMAKVEYEVTEKVTKYLNEWTDDATSECNFSHTSDCGYSQSVRSISPDFSPGVISRSRPSRSPRAETREQHIPTRTMNKSTSGSLANPLQFVTVKTNTLADEAKKVIEITQKNKIELEKSPLIKKVLLSLR